MAKTNNEATVLLGLLVSWVLVAGVPVHAQHMGQPDSPCAGIVTTSDLVACLYKAGAASEAEMNSLYKKIESRLEPVEIKQLKNAQDLWLKYREAHCSAERSLYGNGTGGPPTYLACIEAVTRERTKDLRATYGFRLEK